MNQNPTLTSYTGEVPYEIRLLLKGLSSDEKIGLLIALLKEGKMTFNEMKEKLKINSSSLTRNLKSLQKGNLITNFYDKSDKKVYSYYDVTDIPELLFESLFDIIAKSDIEEEPIEHISNLQSIFNKSLNYTQSGSTEDEDVLEAMFEFADKVTKYRSKRGTRKKLKPVRLAE